jgi:hypothetical protein
MPVSASLQTFALHMSSAMTLGGMPLVPHAVEERLIFGGSAEAGVKEVRSEASSLAEPLILAARDPDHADWSAGLRLHPHGAVAVSVGPGTILSKDLRLVRGWLDRSVGSLVGRAGLPKSPDDDLPRDQLAAVAALPLKKVLFGAAALEPTTLLDLAYAILRTTKSAWPSLDMRDRHKLLYASEEAHRRGRVGFPDDLTRALEAKPKEGVYAGPPAMQRVMRSFLLSGLCLMRADGVALGNPGLAEGLRETAVSGLRASGHVDAAAMSSELWTELARRQRWHVPAGWRTAESLAARDWGNALGGRDDDRAEVVRIYQGLLYALAGASWGTVESFFDGAANFAYRRGHSMEEGFSFMRMAQARVYGALEEQRDFSAQDWRDVEAMLAAALKVFAQSPPEHRAIVAGVRELWRSITRAS